MSDAEDDSLLAGGQRLEERLASVDYDVWCCDQCGHRLTIPYKRWSSYSECRRCHHRTVETTRRTMMAATTVSTGLEQIDERCKHCGWSSTRERVIPRIVVTSSSSSGSSSSGGSRSGGGSSFGGGSAGGGGAGGRY